MGIWGLAPLENDAALDWLEMLFDDSGLEAYFEASVNQDIHEFPHEVRAAAHLFHTLDKAGFWPCGSRHKFADLAVSRLEKILAERVITNACMVAEVRKEIAALREHASVDPSLHWPQP